MMMNRGRSVSERADASWWSEQQHCAHTTYRVEQWWKIILADGEYTIYSDFIPKIAVGFRIGFTRVPNLGSQFGFSEPK